MMHQVAAHLGSVRALRRAVLLAAAVLLVTGVWAPPPHAGAQAPEDSMGLIPASRVARNVVVIPIEGELDPRGVLARSVERRIQTAVRAGANALVFRINLTGGSGGAERIARAIRGAPVTNTVAWIDGVALEGGVLIALACQEIVVGETAEIGRGFPVLDDSPTIGRGRRPNPQAMVPGTIADAVNSARLINDRAGAYIRDEYLARALIVHDLPLWLIRKTGTGQLMAATTAEMQILFPNRSFRGLPIPLSPHPTPDQAVSGAGQGGFVTQVIPSLRPVITPDQAGKWELVEAIADASPRSRGIVLDGPALLTYGIAANATTIVNGQSTIVPVRGEADLAAFFSARHVRTLDRAWHEGFVLFITHPWVRAGLIVLFLVCMFIEMTNPGASFPGIISLLSLLMLLAPPFLIGLANWWEIAAILAGIALLAMEIFVLPGFGIPGIVGLVLLTGGLVATFIPAGAGLFPQSPGERSDALYGLTAVVLGLATAGGAIFVLARHLPSIPLFGKLVLKDPDPEEIPGTELSAMALGLDDAVQVGEEGVALTVLRPAGRVEVGGRIVDAVSEFGLIQSGARVRVVSSTPMRIGVEAITGPGGSGPTSGGAGAGASPDRA